MKTLYGCPCCLWYGLEPVTTETGEFLDDMHDRPPKWEVSETQSCPECAALVEEVPACRRCGERPATDDDWCDECTREVLIPGRIVLQTDDSREALRQMTALGPRHVVTAGIEKLFAVREVQS